MEKKKQLDQLVLLVKFSRKKKKSSNKRKIVWTKDLHHSLINIKDNNSLSTIQKSLLHFRKNIQQ
jgi:hypothetical protein